MIQTDLSILVVDDTRFSATFMVRALEKAGYRDVQAVSSGQEALTRLDARPVSVMLIDWMMPHMDGLELCRHIREKDEQRNHFTYVVLITGKDSPEAILEAFGSGVDDFIDKNRLKAELLPRVYAAGRITSLHNDLLQQHEKGVGRHGEGIRIDPISGLGNDRYAAMRLRDALMQCDARGGQVWYMALGIANAKEILSRHGDDIGDEIVVEFSRRLKHQVRPLDFVAQLSPDRFGVICYVEREERDLFNALRRVHEHMNHKEFKTGAGFIEVNVGSALLSVPARHAQVRPEMIMAASEDPLTRSFRSGEFETWEWSGQKAEGGAGAVERGSAGQ